MADVGYAALVLALVVAVYTAVAAVLGERRGYAELLESSRNGVIAVIGLVSLASVALLYALFSHDFRLAYVASYTDLELAAPYILSAFWGGLEGSLLLWAWLLSIFLGMVVWQARKGRNRQLISYVIVVTMVINAFYLGMMVFASNPFRRLAYAAADGNGLNPLLQNPGMFFHPPTTYFGYAGFTIPFAFAIAALLTRRLGNEWLMSIRRWTLFSWAFLTLGNLFGMQWAYVELGWGGYWAWDPVENSSLMPWLVGTAFLHSVMIQKRRGMLKVWNMVLIILTFTLTIFGTMISRSGLLSSVHSFGQTALGPVFLIFIGITLVFSFGLLFDRLPYLRSEDALDSFVSREASFLANNLFLVGITFATFWGTIFPFISEAARGVKITVGAPFFNQVNAPILAVLLVIMGICPLIGWRQASTNNLVRNFLYPVVSSFAIVALLFAIGVRDQLGLIGFGLCGFVASTILFEWLRGVRARHRTRGEIFLQALLNLINSNHSRYGGYIVHLGVILLAIAIVGSAFFMKEQEISMAPGQTTSIGNYTLKFEGLNTYATVDREVTSATLSLLNAEKVVDTLYPEKYTHAKHDSPVTEVAIRTTPLEDLYVILSGWEADGSAVFRFIVNPLMVWMWVGGAVMIVGAIFAFWPDRRERAMLARARVEED